MEEAVKHLMNMGHRKIGFIGEALTKKKAARFLSSMKKYALPIHEEYIIMSEERFEIGGYQSMKKLLELEERPTAVIFGYDYMALGGMKCVKDHGLSVPDDISIIGMDILQRKMKNIYHTETHVLEASLIKRETVKNLKKTE